MPWSELPRWRLEVELAKIGTTISEFVCDARDVPELQPWIEDLSPDAKLQVALEWFGDQGNPQPAERQDWHGYGRTPDWLGGRLPALEDGEPASRIQHRDPLPPRQTADAIQLRVVEHKSWPKIRKATGISHRKVNYIRLALKHGDLAWDRGSIALGPETRNTPAGLVLPVR
jgi:hypothetical protein